RPAAPARPPACLSPHPPGGADSTAKQGELRRTTGGTQPKPDAWCCEQRHHLRTPLVPTKPKVSMSCVAQNPPAALDRQRTLTRRILPNNLALSADRHLTT